mmetsp:Transcript_5212/g.10488  ORF Transcript_5212/g.10488 Transcript_5212/m.10488 type:complete len:88 (+) Transcript_5212:1246-1509(+)
MMGVPPWLFMGVAGLMRSLKTKVQPIRSMRDKHQVLFFLRYPSVLPTIDPPLVRVQDCQSIRAKQITKCKEPQLCVCSLCDGKQNLM